MSEKLALQGRLTFCRSNPRLDLRSIAQELHVSQLEIDDDLSLDLEEVRAIRDDLAQRGIEVDSFHIPCTCEPLGSARLEQARERIRLGIERAAQLGSRSIVLVPRTPPGSSIDSALQSYSHLASFARQLVVERGIGLSVNNSGLHAAAFGNPQYFVQLCESLAPDLRMTLDIANWQLGGECPFEAIRQLAPWIDVVHIKDWTVPSNQRAVTSASRSLAMEVRRRVMSSHLGGVARQLATWLGVSKYVPRVVPGTDGIWYQGAMIGDGIVDIPGCFKTLRTNQFQGTVVIEYEGTGDLEQAYRIGVARVRQMLARHDESTSPAPTDVAKHTDR